MAQKRLYDYREGKLGGIILMEDIFSKKDRKLGVSFITSGKIKILKHQESRPHNTHNFPFSFIIL